MKTEPVLEFKDAAIEAVPLEYGGLSGFNARFMPGTAAFIRLESGAARSPLADMAEGILVPGEGAVLFQGEGWSSMPPERALIQRSRIGRVFEDRGWISNLNVNENITLSQRHHTRRPVVEILDEARALASEFGLGALPEVRPAVVPRGDLRRAEWVRAFLGRPMLVMLERPMQGVPSEYLPQLLGAVWKACARGAAVVWISEDELPGFQPPPVPAAMYAVRGTEFKALKQGLAERKTAARV